MSFTDKKILLTGASSGIGKACALSLAASGASLVFAGRDSSRLAELPPGAPETLFVTCDLADPDAPGRVGSELRKKQISLDGCVLSAGIHDLRPFAMESAAALKDLWQVNVSGSLSLLAGIVKARVLTSGASVVLFSSAAAAVGGASHVSYASTKGAIEAATRSLAVELARNRIRVNAVAPGIVSTPMTDRYFERLLPEQIAALESRHLLGLGKPEDVASAVVFLLSTQASWITGTVLSVDGGFSIA